MNPIIIPVRAHRSLTKRAIESALAQDISNLGVLVIDNDSDCHEYLRSLSDIMLSTYRPAQGLNYIWNQALSRCFDTMKYKHALVVNNDVWLRPDTYRLLAEAEGDFLTGISVGKLEQTQTVNLNSRSPHPDFSCFLMRRSVWNAVGEFDERFHVYASDGDYHLRMHQKGIQAEALDLPFLHEVSGTIKYSSPELREELCKIADKDRATFRQKWGYDIGSPKYYEQFGVESNRYATTGRL